MSGWTGKKVISLFNIISLLMKKIYIYINLEKISYKTLAKKTKRKTDVMSKTYQG